MKLYFLSFSLLLISCKNDKADTSISDTSDILEPNSPVWSVSLEYDERGAFLSAWSTSSEDIWVVGGLPDSGIILRGNKNTGWDNFVLPSQTPLLNWIHGTSESDVWVGGLYGTLLHWNGAEWEDHSQDVLEAVWGIFVLDNEVVAVGGESKWGGTQGFVWRFDGTEWSSISLPSQVSDVNNLFKVTYDGEAYWMVGAAGTLLYGQIDNLEAIPTGFATDLITVSPSPRSETKVLVVGGRGTGIYFWGENGVMGEKEQSIAGLNGVFVASKHTLMVGEMGYGILFDEFQTQATEPIAMTRDILHATTAVEHENYTTFYAVGGNLAAADDNYHGVILTLTVEP